MKKLIIAILVMATISCNKKDSQPESLPDPSVIVNSTARLCTAGNCGQVRFNYSVLYPERVKSINFVYGISIPVTVQPSGTFTLNSVPGTVRGYFEITTKEGKLIKGQTNSYQ